MNNKNLDHIKNKEVFKIPEKYLCSLPDLIVSKLPERELTTIEKTTPVVTIWDKIKPLAYLAAMFIGAALIIRVMKPSTTSQLNEFAKDVDIEQASEEFIQEVIDGTYFDDYSMHVFLTNNTENDEW